MACMMLSMSTVAYPFQYGQEIALPNLLDQWEEKNFLYDADQVIKLDAIGEAYDLSTNELQYRELHFLNDKRTIRVVAYFNSEQERIAEKIVRYDTSGFRPSIEQRSYSSQQWLKVLNQGPTVSVIHSPASRVRQVNPAWNSRLLPPKKKISSSETGVIDAGFDRFVRTNWQSLLDGQRVTLNFLAITRQQWVKLRISQLKCQMDIDALCFRVEPANAIVRWLVEPIDLVYDSLEMRLLSFKGLSNLVDADGKGYKVSIHYNYRP